MLNKNAKTFNDSTINLQGKACVQFQKGLPQVVAFCQDAVKAKEEGKLNEFLFVNKTLLVQEKIVETKNEVKTSYVQIRDNDKLPRGADKNTISRILVIGANSEIALTLPKTSKVNALNGLVTFINNVKNPKNTVAKNKGKKSAEKTTSEKNENSETVETLSSAQFVELAKIQGFTSFKICNKISCIINATSCGKTFQVLCRNARHFFCAYIFFIIIVIMIVVGGGV